MSYITINFGLQNSVAMYYIYWIWYIFYVVIKYVVNLVVQCDVAKIVFGKVRHYHAVYVGMTCVIVNYLYGGRSAITYIGTSLPGVEVNISFIHLCNPR